MRKIKIKSFLIVCAIVLAPLQVMSGGAECYPCGESNPGVVCPTSPTGSGCGIEYTATGWKVTCFPGESTVTGVCDPT
jgi:hypothetical protein